MSDTTPAAEKPADATEAADQADTPAATETDATDAHSDAQAPDAAGDDDAQVLYDADTFPRAVVEKLRREASGLRNRVKTAEERAQAAETRVQALQQQAADKAITAAGIKPAAVWAVAELADVLDDAGTVDAAKLTAAMQTAKQTLGVPGRRPPRPGGGDLKSGAGVPQSKPQGFAAAFGPPPK